VHLVDTLLDVFAPLFLHFFSDLFVMPPFVLQLYIEITNEVYLELFKELTDLLDDGVFKFSAVQQH